MSTNQAEEYLDYMYEEAEIKSGVKPKSKPNPDFYHQEFNELFTQIELEHQTPKAFLFNSNKGKFWCPKSMIRCKEKSDILEWKIWKSFEYKFIKEDK